MRYQAVTHRVIDAVMVGLSEVNHPCPNKSPIIRIGFQRKAKRMIPKEALESKEKLWEWLRTPCPRLSPREKILMKIKDLEKKRFYRISKGRTPGSGAGGFNRDIENLSHQIQLLKIQLEQLY